MKTKTKINLALTGIMLPFAAVAGYGLSDEAGARDTLQKAGYTDAQYKGHTILGCGEGDIYRDKFTAKNAQGMTVETTVCKGFFKGATVRFD